MAYTETKFKNDELKFFYNVNKSVGPNRPNRKTDVALVQTLLRNCYDGGDIAKLQIDGDFGSKTKAAIRKFQDEYSIFSVKEGLQALEKDGIVTHADNMGFDGPNGKIVAYTIVALNYTLNRHKPNFWKNIPYDPNVPVYLRVELMKTSG